LLELIGDSRQPDCHGHRILRPLLRTSTSKKLLSLASDDSGCISPARPNKIASFLLNGLELVALLFGIYCVYRAKGLRWFTAAVVVAELWILFAAGFFAGMSVTGDWL
jgi:hypothetical protein